MAPVKGYHIIFSVVFVFVLIIFCYHVLYIEKKLKKKKKIEENTEEFLNIEERIKTFLICNAEKHFLFTFFTFFIFIF